MGLMNKIKEWGKKDSKLFLVDTTSLLTESNPIYSAFEVGVAGMSDSTSIKARLLAVGISYLGMGRAFTKGRDLSRKFFDITQESKEKVQYIHDIGYTAAFNLAICPLMYYIAGARDMKEIAIGTLTATSFSAVNGGFLGYSVDIGRDLTGLEECTRQSYPKFIKKQKKSVKKMIAAGLVAASIGAMAGIYSLTPNENNQNPSQTLEQQVSNIQK